MTAELVHVDAVAEIQAPLRMGYTYVAGRGSSLFLRALREGKILGRRCPSCGEVYAPPPSFCSRDLAPLDPPFELPGTGKVATFCIVNFTFPGQAFEPPYVVAHVHLDGAGTRLMHLIGECAPDDVVIGMRVEPVWVPAEERQPSLESIRYFRPIPAGGG